MQRWSLTMDKLIDHAARWHGTTAIASRSADGAMMTADWASVREDARPVTAALTAHGISYGDRVAPLAMNGSRHLAAWFGIMNMGAVCHTLNPRLSDEQLRYVVNHAADRMIVADRAFLPTLERIRADCPTVERIIWLDG